jgi:MoxR-like ATPase
VLRHDELNTIAAAIQASVQVAPATQDYLHRLWLATRDPAGQGVVVDGVDMARLIAAGASPRAVSMLARAARVAAWLAGRDYLVPEDVQAVFAPALRHRIFFTPVYEMRRAEIGDALMNGILARVGAPQ